MIRIKKQLHNKFLKPKEQSDLFTAKKRLEDPKTKIISSQELKKRLGI